MATTTTGASIELDAAQRTLDLEIEGLRAVRAALSGELGQRLDQAAEVIKATTGRVIVTGMGKSGHVARKITATMASTGTPASYVHPSEASHGDLGMIGVKDVVLALSWSGETPELGDIIAYSRRFGVPLIAITSGANSALGRAADVALILPVMEEACPNGLAPTTSTTMQLALGDALAVALLSGRGFSALDFREFHPGGKLGARLKSARELMHGAAAMPRVGEAATLSEAIVEMTGKRFGVTAVVDAAGRLVGVITDGDLRRAFKGGFTDQPVAAVMNRTPRTIPGSLLAQQALALMQERKITSLFVVEEEAPIGILHLHDLLAAGVV